MDQTSPIKYVKIKYSALEAAIILIIRPLPQQQPTNKKAPEAQRVSFIQQNDEKTDSKLYFLKTYLVCLSSK